MEKYTSPQIVFNLAQRKSNSLPVRLAIGFLTGIFGLSCILGVYSYFKKSPKVLIPQTNLVHVQEIHKDFHQEYSVSRDLPIGAAGLKGSGLEGKILGGNFGEILSSPQVFIDEVVGEIPQTFSEGYFFRGVYGVSASSDEDSWPLEDRKPNWLEYLNTNFNRDIKMPNDKNMKISFGNRSFNWPLIIEFLDSAFVELRVSVYSDSTFVVQPLREFPEGHNFGKWAYNVLSRATILPPIRGGKPVRGDCYLTLKYYKKPLFEYEDIVIGADSKIVNTSEGLDISL